MHRAAFGLIHLLAFIAFPLTARAEDLFGPSFSGTTFSQFQQWRRVLDAETAATASAAPPAVVIPASAAPDACEPAQPCTPADWNAFLDGLRQRPAREQLAAVDGWVNRRPYVEDLRNWAQADYWETPEEFLARGGDCEDFAIAKYFSLRRLGWADADLRIVIARDLQLNAYHALLAVRTAGEVLLLDNQSPGPTRLEDGGRYRAIFVLNAQGWRMEAMPELALGGMVVAAAGPGAP